MVVGAGRGPLVKASIRASLSTGVLTRIYAVEKNLHAVITLRNRAVAEEWANVQIIEKDMRRWTPPERADIMVRVSVRVKVFLTRVINTHTLRFIQNNYINIYIGY
jgi:tRNA G37 N-methylase Trm5